MHKYDIYGIGAALVDTEIQVSDGDLKNLGIDKGIMTLVDEERQHQLMGQLADHLVASTRASGGSAANSIIAASYFGAKTFYSCRVANDDNGRFYLRDLSAAGVTYHSYNGSAEGITGKCLVMITPDAERTMNTFLGQSELLSIQDIDTEALKTSRFAYIEGYLVTSATGLPAAIELKNLAQEHKVATAISLSDPAIVEFFRAGLSEVIGTGVDLLFCNEAEAKNFTQTESLEEACSALKNYAKTFAVTLGGDGALLFDGEKTIEIVPHSTQAIDTNGAGDMFAGAFLYGLSEGMNYAEAGRLASRAAARVVSQFGPRLKGVQHSEVLDQHRSAC